MRILIYDSFPKGGEKETDREREKDRMTDRERRKGGTEGERRREGVREEGRKERRRGRVRFVAFADFRGVSTPTVDSFKLPKF